MTKLSHDSKFFKRGFFKKTEFCPKSYKTVRKGDTLCGRVIEPNENGNLVLDVRKTLENCLEKNKTYLVEKKFDGHRGVLEYEDGRAAMFSEKKVGNKPLPMGLSKLLAKYFSGTLESKSGREVNDVILDGEVFLKECKIDGMRMVPEIAVQVKAIKGQHPELMDKCIFSYQVFDIIRLNGKDVTDLPIMERKEIIKQLLPKSVIGRLSDLVNVKNDNGKSITTKKNLVIEPVTGKLLSNLDEIHAEFCRSTTEGHEGLVIKDPNEDYQWEGRTTPYRKGWKKLKEEFNINASVSKACLGSWHGGIKTNRHLARYKDLLLSACKDKTCDSDYYIARSGMNTQGGPIKGWADWDEMIHYPILKMIKDGTAKPSKDTKYHKIKDIKYAVRRGKKGMPKIKGVVGFAQLEKMMGCDSKGLECTRDHNGEIALPKCVDIPFNDLLVEVVTTEINMHDDKPHLGGPPRIVRVREDIKVPDNVSYLKKLYQQEVGL